MNGPTSRPGTVPWDRVRTLFDELQPLPAGERAARLEALAADGSDAGMLAELRALLSSEAVVAEDFLAPAGVPAGASGGALHAGQILGGWRVAERLGAGGMGEVWRAERADGAYDGVAAVKVLRSSLSGPELRARFAAERRALARLEHPHIARLLDAGNTAAGVPYVVMEFVHGRPLDEACIGRPLAARIGLFLQLCDAVSHAHRQLLLHRDLKPANVLVTATQEVKLLDFGIAKMLDDHGSGSGADPTQGLALFTPRWASPEQVRGEAVGTASDVYSLGVLLYRLLTGRMPYGRGVDNPLALAEAVLHEAPQRPSRAVAQGALVGEPTAALALPAAVLRGDLDTVVLKALEKAPSDRYADVEALAADLRAWRDGFPIAARPAPLGLRVRKFVGRNRLASGLAVLAAALLVSGLVATQWQRARADEARRVAERRLSEVRDLTRQIVFRYHDQIQHLPGAVAVRSALLDDAARFLDGLAPEAAYDPGFARELAETWHRLSVLQGESFSPSQERVQAALATAQKATALQAVYLGRVREPAVLHAAVDMWLHRATVEARLGRLDASNASLAEARMRAGCAAAAEGEVDVQLLSRLATLEGRIALNLGANLSQASLGRVAEAQPHWDEAVRLFERVAAREPNVAEWVHQLAWGWMGRTNWAIVAGRTELAVAAGRRATALRDRAAAMAPGNSHLAHQRALVRNNLATALSLAGEQAEALALQQEAVAMIRTTIAADPSNKAAERDLVLVTLSQARPLLALGRRQQALEVVRSALRALPAEAVAADDFYLARWRAEALVWWARLHRREAPAEAVQAAQTAVELLRTLGGGHHASRRWAQGQAQAELALALRAQGRPAEARVSAHEAMATWGDAVPAYFAPQQRELEALLAAGG
jgi:tetratricopeptide (TPR) repeat protein